jgi:hypothetical protein
MHSKRKRCAPSWVTIALGAVVFGALGCNSQPSPKTKEADGRPQAKRAANAKEDSARPQAKSAGNAAAAVLFNGGKYCVETMAQHVPGPTQPIHFSYKKNESDGSAKDFESTLAGDTFDVTFTERRAATDLDRELSSAPGAAPVTIRDGFVESTRANHYNRADGSAWTAGWGSVERGGTPWSEFILKPTTTPAGSENIAGYDTIRFAVDTSHQSALEKSVGNVSMGSKDYNISGSAWVTKDTGCILQYTIDVDTQGKDGKVGKKHYEGGVTKQ